jgi:hypothetical protein
MSLRNRLVLPVVLSTLAFLVGCGSSTNTPQPPPSGAFSNTAFNGTYTFSVSGSDANGIFMMSGSFTACGCTAGTISGGTADFYDGAPTIAPASAIGASTYSITQDGRGTATLALTIDGTATPVTLAFVLTSSSHGLIIRYDDNGTGSGTIDLQPAAISQTSIENTPYAFSFSGEFNGNPLATVGAFTLNSSGFVSTGVEDFNENAFPYTALPITAGFINVPVGTSPGTAQFTTSFGTLDFDVYPVDATHLKLISTNALLVGDVFTQPSASIPQGNLVFGMGGEDTGGFEFAVGGLMASDGVSQISSGSEDINDDGLVDNGTNPATPFGFSGSFSNSGGGRFLISLTGFAGGTNFAAYPSSGGILLLEVDTGINVGTGNVGITSGTALAQASGATLAAAQGYGFNNSGEDINNDTELDEVGQFTTTSTGLSGLLDENDFTVHAPFVSNVDGTYTANSNGMGSATIGVSLNEVFFYAADSSTAMFISVDQSQAALGVMEGQTAPGDAKSASVRPHVMPMLRVLPHPRSVQHQQTRVSVQPAKQK